MKIPLHIAIYSILFLSTQVEAGQLLVPAWAFDRGNVQIHADPDEYADAGPVVTSGPRKPWGWTVEYDLDLPVAGDYTFQVCYASAEPRPVQFFVDSWNMTKCCEGVTLDPKSSGQPDKFTGNSSGAKWEGVKNQWGKFIARKLTNGVHTVKLTRRGPLPHLVAFHVATTTPFPEDWKPPQYKVRDIKSVPEEHRKTFKSPSGSNTTFLRQEIERMIRLFGPRYPDGAQHLSRAIELEKKQNDDALTSLQHDAMTFWTNAPPKLKKGGSLNIPAWSFDRGNVRIYASPDQFADAGPIVGNDPEHVEAGVVEYDIDFPVAGDYSLTVKYAAAEARPVEVFLDGKSMGKCCYDITFGSAPFEIPVTFSWDSSSARKKQESFEEWGIPRKITIAKGKHTLKFARNGPLPNFVEFRLESSSPFPKGWKQPSREMPHLNSVPARERSVFMAPDSVNIAALRLAIEDTIRDLGPEYPQGLQFLERLAKFEKEKSKILINPRCRIWSCEEGIPEEQRTMENELVSLRREAMLAHPALKFDKLLFFKRKSFRGNTYQDNQFNDEGGSLCVLSPVSAEGKITSLVPELDGGIFTRFNLSFDAKKVVFGYKRKDKPFRIYEIDIDPAKGVMVPGSLRQLTFDDEQQAEALRTYGGPKGGAKARGLDDMDPCYLPGGNIMFSSTRSKRNVFCHPSIVANLHLMDGDGKNMQCISGGPLSEMDPTMLDDGRVIFTRWEYVDKGLGNGQALWAVRPDGSGIEHIYKNSIIRPAQLLNARNIPGSRKLITVASPHCGGRLGGPVVLVDNRATRRSAEGMDCITPEQAYPCMNAARYDMGFFREPYPFSEKFYLVSHNPGTKRKKPNYGIYVLDAWGNRAPLHRDPELSCYQPVPLRPRRRPTQIASFTSKDEKPEKTGTIFVQDVYEGMTGIERGRVKYIRVMGALPWPWSEKGIFRVSKHGTVHRKKVYGTAEVHEDGSTCFTVPAGENIFFQALDENYMQLQHMPTFINLMPGERRSCIGCHEERRKAPGVTSTRPMAMERPVQELSPQPGDTGPRMIHYVSDVQPILDKHCVNCHGSKNPKGHLDLTGEVTENWNRSYENIVGKGLVAVRDSRYGRSGFRPEPPLSFGSHISKLVEQIRREPCKAKLTQEEFIRIVTWVDANSPYLGKYGEHGGSKQ
jgi:hypothetical protein